MACADSHRCGWQGGIISSEDRPHDAVKLMENGRKLNRRLLGAPEDEATPYCSQRQHGFGSKEEKYLSDLRGFSKTNQGSGSYSSVVCLVRCYLVSQARHVIESRREGIQRMLTSNVAVVTGPQTRIFTLSWLHGLRSTSTGEIRASSQLR